MDWGSLINTSVLAGWIRAVVASGLGVLIAKVPFLGDVLSPDVQAAIGAAASGIVVGVWSHIAKVKS